MLNKEKSYIWITFEKEGIHQYLGAPDEVEFLKYPHRHMFKFKVWLEVKHDDRDVEFIIFKRWCENQYQNNTLQLNNKSCEMIARELVEKIQLTYQNRDVLIEVSEDGENGCLMVFPYS